MERFKRTRAGFLIALTLINLIPGSFAISVAHAVTADESLGLTNMSRRNTQRIAVQQAMFALAAESSDIDGDGYIEAPAMLTGTTLAGGGLIPLSSAAPKNDSYGTNLGYCSFDNGSVNSSAGRIAGAVSGYNAPVLAVVSAGVDNVFQTTCADIAAGTAPKGDDYVLAFNSTQIQMGGASMLYYGDPVANMAALNALAPASLRDGQVRLAKDTNSLYRWNTSTGSWTPVGGGASLSSLTAATASNTINNGLYGQKWNWQLTDNTTAFEISEGASASSGGSDSQYLFRVGTVAGSTAVPFSVAARGVEAFRVDSANPQIVLNNGSKAAPTLVFNGDKSAGFYYENTAGFGSTISAAIGGSRYFTITGSGQNIGIGKNTLVATTTGKSNVAIGSAVLQANTSGTENAALGLNSMAGNTTGSNNTAVGSYSLQTGAGSFGNTAIGYQSLQYAVGHHNTGVGYAALQYAGGGYNVAIGATAGEGNSNVNNSNKLTLLGSGTAAILQSDTPSDVYMTAIGADVTVSTQNTIVLGRPQDKTVIGNTGDNGSGHALQVTGGIQAITGNITNSTGQFLGMPGSAAAPTYSFTSGVSTGIYMPAASQLSAAIDGTRFVWLDGTSDNNIGIGRRALASNANGEWAIDNVAIGESASSANTYGMETVAIGSYSLAANTDGSWNTAIGAYALNANTTGESNSAVGAYSLYYNTTGQGNNALGVNALGKNTTGNFNVAVGDQTLSVSTTGSYIVAVGQNALWNSTTASDLVALGRNAGYTHDNYLTAGNSTFVGSQATIADTAAMASSGYITLVGSGATASGLSSAVPNSYMTAIGAGSKVTSINTIVLGRPTDTTVIGANNVNGSSALLQINGASQHVGLASAPAGAPGLMYYDSTLNQMRVYNGTAWSALGAATLSSITAATANNIIANGTNSQSWNWQLSSNTTAFSIGETAASTGGTSASQFLMTIGTKAGSSAIPLSVQSGGVEAFRIDSASPRALFASGTKAAPGISFLGYQDTGFYAPASGKLYASIGGSTAFVLDAVNFNVSTLGSLGQYNSGTSNVAIGGGGWGNMVSNTTGSGNVSLGRNALNSNTTGNENVAIGSSSLFNQINSSYNVGVGYGAGIYMSGQNNVAIGQASLRDAKGTSNIGIGYLAVNRATGSYNTGVGESTLSSLTSGGYNVAIGYGSGGGSVTGSNSVFIGYNAKAASDLGTVTMLGSNTIANLGASTTNANAYMTAVGSGASVTTVNTIVLGRNTDKTVIGASADNGSSALLQITGASQYVGLASAPTGAPGMIYYDSNLGQLRYYSGSSWQAISSSLSDITSATAANTITNGAFSQVWNWQLTGNSSAFSIGESAASTGGTGTQYLASIGTLNGSTASPLRVLTRGVEAFRVDSVNPQLLAASGTVAAPAYGFSAQTGTGMYMPSTTSLAFAVGGSAKLTLDSANSNVFVMSPISSGMTGTGNIGVGAGYGVLASNTSGNSNIAIGSSAANANTTGSDNIAIGRASLYSSPSSIANVAIGPLAMQNGSGNNNVAIGLEALSSSSGGSVIAIGYRSHVSGTGNNDIAIGVQSMRNAGGSTNDNIAIGRYALYNSNSTYSVAIGYDAADLSTNVLTGGSSIFLGAGATVADTAAMAASGNLTLIGAGAKASGLASSVPAAYMTAIGSGASVTTVNTIVLGRTTDKTVIGATGDSGSAALLQINGASQHVGMTAAPTGTAGMMYYDSTLKKYRYHDGTSWQAMGGAALHQITAATTSNTINNGDNQQTWNWSLSPGSTGFSIGESAAGGAGVLMKIATLAGSNTNPLSVDARGTNVFYITSAGQFALTNGTIAAPTLTFGTDRTSGFYSAGAGNLNAAVGGQFALGINSSNTSIGYKAGRSSSIGNTVAIGVQAAELVTGAANTAVGSYSMLSTNSGTNNSALGTNSLINNTVGSYNTAIGVSALSGITTGSYNTAIGYYAGQSGTNTNGSGAITLIGANTNANLSAANSGNVYMTAIGAGASVSSVNTVVLGRASDNVVIGQTSSGPQQFYVNGTAGGTSAYATSSDIRFKTNIRPLESAMDILKNLQGVSYEFNQTAFPERKFETGRQIGFIAQQIEPYVPEVVRTDLLGYKSVQYSQLMPMVVEALKEHQSILQHLKKRDDVTLAVDIATFEGNDAHFKRIEVEKIKTKQLEAESARIAKLQAEEIAVNKIDAKQVRTDVVKTGETDAFIGAGAFQPMFAPNSGEQYVVNATAEDGTSAFVSVTVVGGNIIVTPIGGKGVDVVSYGSKVGIAGANKRVKATWIRMS